MSEGGVTSGANDPVNDQRSEVRAVTPASQTSAVQQCLVGLPAEVLLSKLDQTQNHRGVTDPSAGFTDVLIRRGCSEDVMYSCSS